MHSHLSAYRPLVNVKRERVRSRFDLSSRCAQDGRSRVVKSTRTAESKDLFTLVDVITADGTWFSLCSRRHRRVVLGDIYVLASATIDQFHGQGWRHDQVRPPCPARPGSAALNPTLDAISEENQSYAPHSYPLISFYPPSCWTRN